MQNTAHQTERASVGQKQRFEDSTWEIVTYDVWGNEKEGFEVNDVYRHGEIELYLPVTVCNEGTPSEFVSAYPTDRQIRQALDLKRIKLSLDGDDLTIYVRHAVTDYPCGELRCISHESLSPIRHNP